jgi:hypothetical protein
MDFNQVIFPGDDGEESLTTSMLISHQVSASECKKVVKEFGDTVAELNAKGESNEVLTLLETKVPQLSPVSSSVALVLRWPASSLRFPALSTSARHNSRTGRSNLLIHTQSNPCRHWTAIETIAGDNISSGVTLEFIEDRGVFEKAMEIKKVPP